MIYVYTDMQYADIYNKYVSRSIEQLIMREKRATKKNNFSVFFTLRLVNETCLIY